MRAIRICIAKASRAVRRGNAGVENTRETMREQNCPRGSPPWMDSVMRSYSLTHLTDESLVRGLASIVERDRLTTADLLSHIAEFDSRRLYAPAAYPSTRAYCVHELRLSEDAASKR